MEIEKFDIEGLVLLKPKIFEDERGYFYESFNKEVFEKLGIGVNFLQDNESKSSKGVLRGMHFQKPPYAQAKLVRVIKGSVLDVVVDIRKSSETYGKHVKVLLTENNKHLFFIPSGFAHGFLTLEDNTIFSYKCSALYNRESEDSLFWNDSELNINWDIENPLLSEKDKQIKQFNEFISPF